MQVGGEQGAGKRAFETLVACYGSAGRVYHNGEHIAECNDWLDRLSDWVQQPLEVQLAIYFHDAVYEIAESNNEAHSAALFGALAQPSGVAHGLVHRVGRLIMATATHAPAAGDGRLLCDIDLAVLGASPGRYQRYARAIRAEYQTVPTSVYRKGRIQVLQGFLSRLAIYHTPPLFEQLEVLARQNLAQELAELHQGDDCL